MRKKERKKKYDFKHTLASWSGLELARACAIASWSGLELARACAI